jgi:hypothetical protein
MYSLPEPRQSFAAHGIKRERERERERGRRRGGGEREHKLDRPIIADRERMSTDSNYRSGPASRLDLDPDRNVSERSARARAGRKNLYEVPRRC